MGTVKNGGSNWLPPGGRPPLRRSQRHESKKRVILGFSMTHWIAALVIAIPLVIWVWLSQQAEYVGDLSTSQASLHSNEKVTTVDTRATTTAFSERHLEAFASRTDGITLATWELALAPTILITNTLVYLGSSIALETKHSDGSSSFHEVTERPTDKPNERRFELYPDSGRSEYITLSELGDVKYFGWEGAQFATTAVISIHVDFMEMGFNPVTKSCVPKDLSETSKEIVLLYEQLHTFKNDPEFARLGFGTAGPYHRWLQTAENLSAKADLASFNELSFYAGDVMLLGLEYMRVAAGRGDLRYIQEMERTIRAGVALAQCTSEPGS